MNSQLTRSVRISVARRNNVSKKNGISCYGLVLKLAIVLRLKFNLKKNMQKLRLVGEDVSVRRSQMALAAWMDNIKWVIHATSFTGDGKSRAIRNGTEAQLSEQFTTKLIHGKLSKGENFIWDDLLHTESCYIPANILSGLKFPAVHLY